MPIATTIATRMTSTFSRQTASLCGGVCVVSRASSRSDSSCVVRLIARFHRGLHLVDLRPQLCDRGVAQAIAPVTNQLLRVANEEMAVFNVARLKHWAKR